MRALAAAAFLIVLAGCPSLPERQSAGGASSDPPAVQDARRRIRNASPASLREAARVLASPDIAESAAAVELAGLGRELFALLYPEIAENPFPAGALSAKYGPLFASVRGKKVVVPDPAETDFFRVVIPGLILIAPVEGVDEVTLSLFENGLKNADEKSGRVSVLPPYLQALSMYRRAVGSSRAGGAEAAEIIALLQECIQRDTTFYPGYLTAADLYSSQGKPADALALLGEAAEALPGNVSILKKMSSAAIAAGKLQEALDASAKALMISPDDAEASMIRARAFELQGSWYQSVRIIEAVLKRYPDMGDAIRTQARLLADKAGNIEEAARLLTAAERRSPADPSYPELLGRILLDAGRGSEGELALARALELAPGRMSTLELLLGHAVRTKRWLQAKTYLAQILVLSSAGQYIATGYTIAWNLGDYAGAEAYARKLVQTAYGEAPEYLLARALHVQGNNAEALPLVEKGIVEAKTPAVKSRFLYLRASIQRTNPEEAIMDLRTALMADGDNLDALLLISELLAGSKQFHAAALYLKRAAALSSEDAGLKARIAELEKLANSQKK
jgi:Flp pilus assembly protein TadD